MENNPNKNPKELFNGARQADTKVHLEKIRTPKTNQENTEKKALYMGRRKSLIR